MIGFRQFLLLLVIVIVAAHRDLPDNAADLPISQLLSLASTALSAGRSASALEIFDHILIRDPSDFATLYKRATIRLATNQLSKAKDGFKEVLRVKEFDQARLQLAKIYAKLGEFDDAKKEVDELLKHSTLKKEGTELRTQLVLALAQLNAARTALASKSPNLDVCIASATEALVLAPHSEELRLLRAECHLRKSEWESAVGDLSRASTLSPNLSPHLLVRLSLVNSLFLDHGLEIPAESWSSLKRCITADPESKPCRAGLKTLKKLERELAKLRNWIEGGRWGDASLALSGQGGSGGLIEQVRQVILDYQTPLPSLPSQPAPLPLLASPLETSSPLVTVLLSSLCRAHVTLNLSKKAAKSCEEVLQRNPEDLWGLTGRGERLMAEENWEEAVRVLSTAFEQTGRSDRSILDRLQKAQRLLKQSTMKDYYKVLGVSRDADAKTIKRAYRKATLKSHPDKGGSESAMQSVNEAYEVLSKPELRARFDQGEDPNDNTQQQQHPFQQGGGFPPNFFQSQDPFGGQSGFKFKFN